MLVTASHVVTGVTRSDRRRRLGQSVVQSVTILQLFGAAVCVMNRLDCDVDMGEQAELQWLEGNRWSDTVFQAPLVPSFMNEFAELLSAGAETEMSASTSDVVTAPLVLIDVADAPAAVTQLVASADDEPSLSIAMQQLNSTVVAAKKRERGLSVTEKRLLASVDAEKAEECRRAKQRRVGRTQASGGGGGANYLSTSSAGGQSGQRRGRARLNAPLATGSTAAAG